MGLRFTLPLAVSCRSRPSSTPMLGSMAEHAFFYRRLPPVVVYQVQWIRLGCLLGQGEADAAEDTRDGTDADQYTMYLY